MLVESISGLQLFSPIAVVFCNGNSYVSLETIFFINSIYYTFVWDRGLRPLFLLLVDV